MLKSLSDHLRGRQNLVPDQIRAAVESLIDPTLPPEPKADFLIALAHKGETVDEIAGFARLLRERAVQPAWRGEKPMLLDVCGTGGDRMHSFNISTAVAIVAAAAGLKVAKHGNRAVTSQAGSADVLEALGVPTELDAGAVVEALDQHGFAFFFAPLYHPAFKHVAPARKLCAERGERTIFNFLGPLLNPARPQAQLVGVPRPDWCEPVARVLQQLGTERAMVVCGATGAGQDGTAGYLDELSCLGPNTVAEFYQERGFTVGELAPDHFTPQPGSSDDLRGGDKQVNAGIIRAILAGREQGPKREAVLLNAGAALFVAGQCASVSEGWEQAAELIAGGAAEAKLGELSRSQA